jgi:hypothetical protein
LGIFLNNSVGTPLILAGGWPGSHSLSLLRQRKEAKKGERGEAALRVRVKITNKTGNETNSPAAQTSFISYPFYWLFLRQLPSAIRPALSHHPWLIIAINRD